MGKLTTKLTQFIETYEFQILVDYSNHLMPKHFSKKIVKRDKRIPATRRINAVKMFSCAIGFNVEVSQFESANPDFKYFCIIRSMIPLSRSCASWLENTSRYGESFLKAQEV
jgi:hypothetical protein